MPQTRAACRATRSSRSRVTYRSQDSWGWRMGLVEREDEMRYTERLLESCAQGKGAIVVVSGPVATGKSAFLHLVTERAAELGWVVLDAAGAEVERSLPMGVVSQLFHGAPLPLDLMDELVRLLDEAASYALLSDSESREAQRERARVMHTLCRTLLAIAETSPLLVAVDDLHHADPASLQLLLSLARRCRGARVMLMLSESTNLRRFHPAFHSDFIGKPHSHLVKLGPLSQAGVAALLAERLDADAAGELAPRLHQISGGNPLLAGALVEEWAAAARGGRPPAPDEAPVDGEYARAVLSCLHRGEPHIRAVAEGLAVIGESHAPEWMGRLLRLDPPAVRDGLLALAAAGLLFDGGFRHPEARSAVVNDIDPARRADLHWRAARLLRDDGAPSVAVARQLVRAGQLHEPWTVEVLCEAAEEAQLNDEVDLAVQAYEAALRACRTEAETFRITAQLAQVEWRLDPAIAARHVGSLVAGLDTLSVGDRHVDWMVRFLLWNGRVAEAVSILERLGGDIECGREATSHSANRRLTTIWRTHSHPPLLDRIRPNPRVVSPPAIAGTPVGPQLQGAGSLAVVFTDGCSEEAVAGAEAVLQNSPLSDSSLARIVPALLALVYADRVDKAAPWCDQLLRESVDRGAPTWQAEFANIRSEISFRQGDLVAAEREARMAMERISMRSWGTAVGAPLAGLVLALTAMGRTDEAAEQLKHPVPEAAFQTVFGLRYLYARGCHLLATGLLPAALDDFLACGQLMREWEVDLPGFVDWRVGAATAGARMGQREDARRLLAEHQQRPAGRQSRSRAMLLVAQAELSDANRRATPLREAIDIFQGCGDRYGQAHALIELGENQREIGEHSRSRVTASMALRVAEECQAGPLVARALALNAGREKGEAWEGPHSLAGGEPLLSEAERRVVALVVVGHSNREIAEKLYVTMSTVEQHLTRIYRKLNIRSRSELPTALQDRAL
ncbi:helix-turn-helix transcriptional regulator [Streptomyces triticirhizae]|uniref:LuxR family transcriptional regulator n=1 Tax=Streptomyces triticirhizae TaxID=2483353 RepID=A0A3M2LMI6_9ACTN|nr:LuxR family transcriptional regulator [Streptomyces triticirhizae]RMI38651.1 LuxR family transcriptional regulator [Streptomyces triticirhizae]